MLPWEVVEILITYSRKWFLALCVLHMSDTAFHFAAGHPEKFLEHFLGSLFYLLASEALAYDRNK